MMLMGIFWIFIIGLLFFLVKWLENNSKSSQFGKLFSETNSMGILKVRYAKGEIDQNEFKQKKQDLENVIHKTEK